MRSLRTAILFGLAGMLALPVNGFASPPPYKIAVSHAIAETFPQIQETLAFLARQPRSPVEVIPKPVRLDDEIADRFKKINVVVAFASEAPRFARRFLKFEPARSLDAIFLAASESSQALSDMTNHTILYPDYREFKSFMNNVVDTCLFSAQGIKSNITYYPVKSIKGATRNFDGLVIKTLMNHRYVFYESLIFRILYEKNMKIVPFYTDKKKERFVKCLKGIGDYDIQETSTSRLDRYADLIAALHQGSGTKKITFQGVVKREEIRLYMKASSLSDFRVRFFPFLFSRFMEFKRKNVEETLGTKEILRTYALGYELITDRNRGVIEVANIWYYVPGKSYWGQLPRRRIQENLGKSGTLSLVQRDLMQKAIRYFKQYFAKMAELRVKKIERQSLEARRMLAYLQYFLHQDARNRGKDTQSQKWLRLSHATIDEYEDEIRFI